MIQRKTVSRGIGALVVAFCSATDTWAQTRIDLGEAVATFNRQAESNEIGQSQPPLTVDEVVASIRRWDLGQGGRAPDAARGEYDEIVQENSLEQEDTFSFIEGWGPVEIDGDLYLFQVWWIDLKIEREDVQDPWGRTPGKFSLRIRDRTISSRKLTPEEADSFLKKKAEMEILQKIQGRERRRQEDKDEEQRKQSARGGNS